MALSVDYLYQYFLRLIRKNQSGSVNGIEFANFFNAEQCSYMSDLLGRFNRQNNGKAGINTGLIQNQTIITKLTPFIKPATITITAGDGNKPSDFQYELSVRINGYACVHINHNQVASVNDSVIDPPSISDNAYYRVEYLAYYHFLPTTVASADIDYIATPPNVIWNYGFDGQGRQVYNPTGSVQPLWDNSSAQEIVQRMLTSVGVSLAAKDFENFGKTVQISGE